MSWICGANRYLMKRDIVTNPNIAGGTGGASYNHASRLFEVDPTASADNVLRKSLTLVHEIGHAVTPPPEITKVGRAAWVRGQIEREALAEAYSYMAYAEYMVISGKRERLDDPSFYSRDLSTTFSFFVTYAKENPLSRSDNDAEFFRRAYEAGLEWAYRVRQGYYENYYNEAADELCKTQGC